MKLTKNEIEVLSAVGKGMDELGKGWLHEMLPETRSTAGTLGSLVRKGMLYTTEDNDLGQCFWVEITSKGAEQVGLVADPEWEGSWIEKAACPPQKDTLDSNSPAKRTNKKTTKPQNTMAKKATTTTTEKDSQNGVTRPKTGSKTAAIWVLADRLSKKKKSPATRNEVIDAAVAEGAAQGTASTQYSRWRTYHGLVGKNAPGRAPAAPAPPVKKAVKKAVKKVAKKSPARRKSAAAKANEQDTGA